MHVSHSSYDERLQSSQVQDKSLPRCVNLDRSVVMRSPCAGAALDPAFLIVPNKALSLTHSLSLSLSLSLCLSLYLSLPPSLSLSASSREREREEEDSFSSSFSFL